LIISRKGAKTQSFGREIFTTKGTKTTNAKEKSISAFPNFVSFVFSFVVR
jgi:hypothetical protein